jgi:hypothetical protein
LKVHYYLIGVFSNNISSGYRYSYRYRYRYSYSYRCYHHRNHINDDRLLLIGHSFQA